MKIYKIAFRNDLEVASNILSKKLLHMIKDLYERGQLFSKINWTKHTTAQYKGFQGPIDIDINIEIVPHYKSNPSCNIKGFYRCSIPIFDPTLDSQNRSISINIIIFSNFSPKDYNYFYQSAVIVIRHELEHLNQDQRKRRCNPSYNPDKIMKNKGANATEQAINRFEEMAKYLSDMAEQDAIVKGLVLNCKKQKKPIMTAIKNLIRGNLFIDSRIEREIKKHFGLQADHIEQILINLYAKKIRELYPNIKEEFSI